MSDRGQSLFCFSRPNLTSSAAEAALKLKRHVLDMRSYDLLALLTPRGNQHCRDCIYARSQEPIGQLHSLCFLRGDLLRGSACMITVWAVDTRQSYTGRLR